MTIIESVVQVMKTAGTSMTPAEVLECPRRLNFDPPCRLNTDPGTGAAVATSGCG